MGRGSSEFRAKLKILGEKIIALFSSEDRGIFIEMINDSGAAVTRGDLVMQDTAKGRNYFTTSTGGNDNKIIGMAAEAMANGAKGLVQVYGPTKYLKVNGTADIAAGDFISSYTEAGIGQKGTIGSGNCIALANEAYTTNDSAGVIDAFLLMSAR